MLIASSSGAHAQPNNFAASCHANGAARPRLFGRPRLPRAHQLLKLHCQIHVVPNHTRRRAEHRHACGHQQPLQCEHVRYLRSLESVLPLVEGNSCVAVAASGAPLLDVFRLRFPAVTPDR